MNRDIRIMTVAMFLWGAGDGLFYFIQPLYIEKLGASPTQIGAVLAMMALVPALSYIPSGYLADRLPRKPALLASCACGVLGMVVCSLAQDWRGLIPGLLLYSLSAYCMPVINAYLATAAGGRDLAKVYTRTSAAYTAGMVISPALGGILADTLSMRLVYVASAVLFCSSLGHILFLSPQTPDGTEEALGHWRILLTPRFLGFAASLLLAFFAMNLAFPLAPNYLADTQGWSASHIGILGSTFSLGSTVLSLILGRMRGKLASAFLLGQALVWLSVLLIAWLPTLGAVALAYALRGSSSACRALTMARAGNLLGESNRGLALGAADTAVVLGAVLAAAAAGWLYQIRPTGPFLVALILIPAGMVLIHRQSGATGN
jgi:MFS family permease